MTDPNATPPNHPALPVDAVAPTAAPIESSPPAIVPAPPDDRDARLAGAEMALAAAQLERDVLKQRELEYQALLREPCTICGKQKMDTL